MASDWEDGRNTIWGNRDRDLAERRFDRDNMESDRNFNLAHARWSWERNQDRRQNRMNDWKFRTAQRDYMRNRFAQLRSEQDARMAAIKGRSGYSVGGNIGGGSAGKSLKMPAPQFSHPGSKPISTAPSNWAVALQNRIDPAKLRAAEAQRGMMYATGYGYNMPNPANLDPNDPRFKFSKYYYGDGYQMDPLNGTVWVKGKNATTSGAPIRQY